MLDLKGEPHGIATAGFYRPDALVNRKRLRSASSHQLSVPCYRLSMYGRWAFSVAGPTVWNSLPKDVRDLECCAVTVTDSR